MKIFKKPPPIIDAVKNLGFKIFTTGEMNLNLIGARHPEQIPDIFNDFLHVVWFDKTTESWIQYKFECTLDPGVYFLNSPMRRDGTAIVKHPQQIRNGLKIG